MLKKILLNITLLMTVCSLTGCKQLEAKDDSTFKIVMVTDSDELMDESYNQITWETCQRYMDTHEKCCGGLLCSE